MIDHDDLADVIIPNRPCPPARCTIEEWEEEASQLPHLKGVWQSIGVTAANARCEYNLAVREGTGHRHDGSKALGELAAKGATFVEIAQIVGASPTEVARHFALQHADVPKFVVLDRLLQEDGHDTYQKLADVSGLTRQQVAHFCRNTGRLPKVARQRAGGGGAKFGPEVYEQVRVMREQGHGFSDIGRRLNINKMTVRKMCLSRGFAPIDVAV